MSLAVLTAAAADSHPLIDLDGTIVIQLGLFFVTLVVASRMLFRPFLGLRDERTAGIDGAREEAVQMTAQADAQLAEYESKVAQARTRALDERAKLRAEAAAHEREVVETTRKKALVAMEETRVSIESQSERARNELAPQAEQLARSIASRLLGREVGA